MSKRKILVVISSLILILLLQFIVFNRSGLISRYKLSKEKERLLLENEQLKVELENLKLEIAKLKNDETYIEQYARDNYKMLKRGEIIVKIENDTDKIGK